MNRWFAAIAVCVNLFSTVAFAEADGPDAWQVTGISVGDTLNVRMGPGIDYLSLGQLPNNARGLENITCTPYITFAIFEKLSEKQRADLPQRWCFVFHQPSGLKGWVAGKFLAEDGDYSAKVPPANADNNSLNQPGDAGSDPQAEEAIQLVSNFMAAMRNSLEKGAGNPLQMPLARQFFFADMIPQIDPGMLGADPILGGQDGEIKDLKVELDAAQPPLQGMYPVKASFISFGQLRTIIFYLRVDTAIAPQMRILQFDADGVSYR